MYKLRVRPLHTSAARIDETDARVVSDARRILFVLFKKNPTVQYSSFSFSDFTGKKMFDDDNWFYEDKGIALPLLQRWTSQSLRSTNLHDIFDSHRCAHTLHACPRVVDSNLCAIFGTIMVGEDVLHARARTNVSTVRRLAIGWPLRSAALARGQRYNKIHGLFCCDY